MNERTGAMGERTTAGANLADAMAELMAGATTAEFLEAVRALARAADKRCQRDMKDARVSFDEAIAWAYTRDRLLITARQHGTARRRAGK